MIANSELYARMFGKIISDKTISSKCSCVACSTCLLGCHKSQVIDDAIINWDIIQ